jgi:uncharacterized protein (TIGR03437 family)
MTRLTFLLWALVFGIGAIVSQAQTGASKTDQGQPRQAPQKKNDITPGYKIIEGDMQVPLTKPPESTLEHKLWPGGYVPYGFDSKVTEAHREVARAAMRVWMNVANIDFRETVPYPYGIIIQNSDENSSPVGFNFGVQRMNIKDWDSLYVVVHELGHALGLRHEQTRKDRDNFVAINGNNIKEDQEHNFEIIDSSLKYGPYDFDSVMHYGQCEFASNCDCDMDFKCKNPVITVKDPFAAQWQKKIGQRDHLSYMDGVTMSFLYPRGNFRFVDSAQTASFQDGTFLDPYSSLEIGINATPVGGTLWLQPGVYSASRDLTKQITIRAPLGAVTIVHSPQPVTSAPALASVSAASYNGEVASESIVAAFGENLAASAAAASTVPLPTQLAGVKVKVKDALGAERDAPLFFVSPNQINYQIPSGSSGGVATVSVYSNGGTQVATGMVPITMAAPALFTANSSGQGAPAASLLRISGDGQFYEPVARYDSQRRQFVPAPIDLGPEGDQVFLILYGVGFRAASTGGVTVTIGGEKAEALYAGAAPGFVGLDQANVRVPRALIGKGEVTIQLTADNRSANAVTINIR